MLDIIKQACSQAEDVHDAASPQTNLPSRPGKASPTEHRRCKRHHRRAPRRHRSSRQGTSYRRRRRRPTRSENATPTQGCPSPQLRLFTAECRHHQVHLSQQNPDASHQLHVHQQNSVANLLANAQQHAPPHGTLTYLDEPPFHTESVARNILAASGSFMPAGAFCALHLGVSIMEYSHGFMRAAAAVTIQRWWRYPMILKEMLGLGRSRACVDYDGAPKHSRASSASARTPPPAPGAPSRRACPPTQPQDLPHPSDFACHSSSHIPELHEAWRALVFASGACARPPMTQNAAAMQRVQEAAEALARLLGAERVGLGATRALHAVGVSAAHPELDINITLHVTGAAESTYRVWLQKVTPAMAAPPRPYTRHEAAESMMQMHAESASTASVDRPDPANTGATTQGNHNLGMTQNKPIAQGTPTIPRDVLRHACCVPMEEFDEGPLGVGLRLPATARRVAKYEVIAIFTADTLIPSNTFEAECAAGRRCGSYAVEIHNHILDGANNPVGPWRVNEGNTYNVEVMPVDIHPDTPTRPDGALNPIITVSILMARKDIEPGTAFHTRYSYRHERSGYYNPPKVDGEGCDLDCDYVELEEAVRYTFGGMLDAILPWAGVAFYQTRKGNIEPAANEHRVVPYLLAARSALCATISARRHHSLGGAALVTLPATYERGLYGWSASTWLQDHILTGQMVHPSRPSAQATSIATQPHQHAQGMLLSVHTRPGTADGALIVLSIERVDGQGRRYHRITSATAVLCLRQLTAEHVKVVQFITSELLAACSCGIPDNVQALARQALGWMNIGLQQYRWTPNAASPAHASIFQCGARSNKRKASSGAPSASAAVAIALARSPPSCSDSILLPGGLVMDLNSIGDLAPGDIGAVADDAISIITMQKYPSLVVVYTPAPAGSCIPASLARGLFNTDVTDTDIGHAALREATLSFMAQESTQALTLPNGLSVGDWMAANALDLVLNKKGSSRAALRNAHENGLTPADYVRLLGSHSAYCDEAFIAMAATLYNVAIVSIIHTSGCETRPSTTHLPIAPPGAPPNMPLAWLMLSLEAEVHVNAVFRKARLHGPSSPPRIFPLAPTHEFDHLVLNCGRDPDAVDVYVGRQSPGAIRLGYHDCSWGNTYPEGGLYPDCSRAQRQAAVDDHQLDFLRDEAGMQRARRMLRGRKLGCWCAPRPCHGHTLAWVANCEDTVFEQLLLAARKDGGSGATTPTTAHPTPTGATSQGNHNLGMTQNKPIAQRLCQLCGRAATPDSGVSARCLECSSPRTSPAGRKADPHLSSITSGAAPHKLCQLCGDSATYHHRGKLRCAAHAPAAPPPPPPPPAVQPQVTPQDDSERPKKKLRFTGPAVHPLQAAINRVLPPDGPTSPPPPYDEATALLLQEWGLDGDNVVLHLFAGDDDQIFIQRACTARGVNAVEFDKKRSARHDLANPELRRAILLAIQHGGIVAVHLGTPCTSYSVAHANGGAPWRPAQHPNGRPDLEPGAMSWLAQQDDLVAFTAEVMGTCLEAGVSVSLEQPAPRNDPDLPSYWPERAQCAHMFDSAPIAAVRKKYGQRLQLVVFPLCALGSPYQKYIGMILSARAAEHIKARGLKCTHAHHSKVAVGTDESGQSQSAGSASYPEDCCAMLIDAHLSQFPSIDGQSLPPLSPPCSRHAPLLPPSRPLSPSAPTHGPPRPPQAGAHSPETGRHEAPAPEQDADAAPPPTPSSSAGDSGGSTSSGSASLPRPLREEEQMLGPTVASKPAPPPPRLTPPTSDSTGLPILHVGGPFHLQHDSVVLAPVRSSATTGAEPLVLLPATTGLFGERESAHRRGGRREAAVDAAAALAASEGLWGDACYLAGEIELSGAGLDEAPQFRTSVVAAPTGATQLHHLPIARSLADLQTIRSEQARSAPGKELAIWTTLDVVAQDATTAAGVARYRAACVAISMTESHVRPTPDPPSFATTGARGERPAHQHGAHAPTAACTLRDRIQRADAAHAELRAALCKAEGSDTFKAWAGELAEQMDRCSTQQIPSELLDMELPSPPADVLKRPYTHHAQVLPTSVKPVPPPPPDDGWRPDCIEDIVEPWALEEIKAWLRACAAWHAAGGPDKSRPRARAFGPDAIKPQARGQYWDLRNGRGDIRPWRPYTPAERQARTCVRLDHAAELLKDCVDKEFVDFLLNGVRFHAGLEPQIVLMPNLLSLYRDGGVTAAAAQIADMVSSGFISLYDDLPSIPFRVCPRGVVGKKDTDELRGIADMGAPRKPLRTARGREWVNSLNDRCRAGDWAHEDKDTLQSATLNGCIVQAIADVAGEYVFEIALDMSKWFHRLFYEAMELWSHGAVVPDAATGGIKLAIEMAMTMGATPASQVAQRFASVMAQQVYKRMDHYEAIARRSNPLPPAQQRIVDERNKMPADSYSTMGRCYDLSIYTDDARACVSGVDRTVRFLQAFYDVAGPDGLNTPLSRAAKQQCGIAVLWLGGMLSAGLGVVWLPPAKALKASVGIAQVLDNSMEVGDYRKLAGFLVSVLFMLGGDPTLMSHIFRPLKPGNEIDGGPATLVQPDQLMAATLRRWQQLLLNTPGAPATAAVRPTPPHANAYKYRIRTDAALQNTPNPGLGGCLYGVWWSVPIADWPVLQSMDIPHLELTAAAVGIITYASALQGAQHVSMETDALATAVAITSRSKSPTMQVILDELYATWAYKTLAQRLVARQIFGAANVLSDAASRGYYDTITTVGRALGIDTQRIAIPKPAVAFLEGLTEKLVPLRPGLGLGSTSQGRHNVSMTQNNPIAHGDSPPSSPPSRPTPVHASGRPPPAPRAATTTVPPKARTPPSRSSVAPPPPKRTLASFQAATNAAKSNTRRDISTSLGLEQSRWEGPPIPTATRRLHAARRGDSPPRRVMRPPSPVNSPPRATSLPSTVATLPTLARPPLGPQGMRTARSLRTAGVLQQRRDELAERMFQRLRHGFDTSDEMVRWSIEVALGDPEDQPANTQSNLRSNWNHWEKWCATMGVETWRPDITDLDGTQAELEKVLWTAGLTYIHRNMKPRPGYFIQFGPHAGQPQPPKPESALRVLRGVRKEHLDRGITPPTLGLAVRRMHELTRRFAKWIGPENLAPHRKATLTHEHIVGMLGRPENLRMQYRHGRRGTAATTDDLSSGGRGKAWTWNDAFGRSYRTLIHVLAQTGFRKGEVTVADEEFGTLHLSFDHLTWWIKGKKVDDPDAAQLLNLAPGDYAIIRPPPSKCDPLGLKWSNHPIYLPFDGSAPINAARALAQWELVARVPLDKRRATPLFCGPAGVGSALHPDTCDDVFHGLLGDFLGSSELSHRHSVHSFRSHLASSMFASKCTDAQIMRALRWSTTEALEIYKNVSMEQYGSWILAAEGQRLTGMRLVDLTKEVGRPQPITDSIEMARSILDGRTDLHREVASADNDVGVRAAVVRLDGRPEPHHTRQRAGPTADERVTDALLAH